MYRSVYISLTQYTIGQVHLCSQSTWQRCEMLKVLFQIFLLCDPFSKKTVLGDQKRHCHADRRPKRQETTTFKKNFAVWTGPYVLLGSKENLFKWLRESVIMKYKHPPKHLFVIQFQVDKEQFTNPPSDFVLRLFLKLQLCLETLTSVRAAESLLLLKALMVG